MRAICIAALCSLPLTAHAEGLELELSPAFAESNDVSAATPLLRARLGVDTGWLTPSLSGMAALFQDPKGLSHGSQDGGIRAWGLAAELRLHNQGRHRVEFGIGAGFGQLITLQQANGDFMGYQGHFAPYVEGALGYHFVSGHLRLGIDATVDAFNRVDMEGDFGVRFCTGAACPLGRTSYLVGLAFSIGVASIPLE